MDASATFLLAEDHQDIDPHLWVVLSDPIQNSNQVVLVSLTTWREDKDQACVIPDTERPRRGHRRVVVLCMDNRYKDGN